jgi:DNA repair protein RadC
VVSDVTIACQLPLLAVQPACGVRGPARSPGHPGMRLEYPVPIVQALPLRERPLHRVQRDVGACNLVELLAAVVGGPRQIEIAHDLLARLKDLGGLVQAPVEELTLSYGLGPVGAARLKAALELGRRTLLAAPEDRPVVRSPADVAQLLMAEMSHLEQEHFRVLYLDTRNRMLGCDTVYVGSLNASHVRVGEVYREAVRRNCAAIICAHNHPSGDPSPSPEDVEVTRQLVKAGELLDVELLDHLILGQQRFVSLRERGLGF